MSMLTELLHQLVFQMIKHRLKTYLKLSDSVLRPYSLKSTEITIDIAQDSSLCLCVTDNDINRVVIVSKGKDIYMSVMLMGQDDLKHKSIPWEAILIYYCCVINESGCKATATFWQQPNGDVTLMNTIHVDPLQAIFNPHYMQQLLDNLQQEVSNVILPLLKEKTQLLLDANAILEEMTETDDDSDDNPNDKSINQTK